MSLRTDAQAELSAWTAPTPEQAALRAAYLDYLAEHPDAMARTCRPAHLTASALVLDPVAGRVLLTLHPKVGRWLQLGGHCEPTDPTLAAAAAREASEESGLPELQVLGGPLRLDRHPVRPAPDRSAADHLDVQYLALASHHGPIEVSAESLDLRWWPADALPAGTDESVRALVSCAIDLTR